VVPGLGYILHFGCSALDMILSIISRNHRKHAIRHRSQGHQQPQSKGHSLCTTQYNLGQSRAPVGFSWERTDRSLPDGRVTSRSHRVKLTPLSSANLKEINFANNQDLYPDILRPAAEPTCSQNFAEVERIVKLWRVLSMVLSGLRSM
jgi:hypothetical protein